MSEIVEMYRDAAERGGRDRFSCSVATWDLLQQIGETFGWRPSGASYVAKPRRPRESPPLESPVRRDYRPGETLDEKRVEQEDAAAWAGALELAASSPHLPAMITARAAAMTRTGAQAAAAPLPGVVAEFVEFAYGGAFTFVLASDADR